MKKKLVSALFSFLTLMCLLLPVKAYSGENPKIFFNDVELKFINNPIIYKGEYMVPFAEIVNKLGGSTDFSKDENTVYAAVKFNDLYETEKTAQVSSNSKIAFINNKPFLLSQPAKKVGSVRKDLLIPVSFVSSLFNYDLKVNNTTREAEMFSGNVEKPADKYAWVHFINVGEGESTYIQLPDKKDILIDTGAPGSGKRVVEYLKQNKVDDIEILIITHTDKMALGGIKEVLEEFNVEKIIDSDYDDGSNIFRDYEHAVQVSGVFRQPHSFQTFNLEKGTLQILTQPKFYNDPKSNSVAAYFKYGDIKILFPGALPKSQEKELTGQINSNILKISNSGSNESTSYELLNKVSPETAVIHVCGSNHNCQPSEEVINRLNKRGISIYQTDNHHIVLKTDGEDYIIKQIPSKTSK